MNSTAIAALIVYALAALLSIAFGAVYLVRSQFMPYHQEAVATPWEQLDPRMQALLLGLMRVAGGGLCGAGLTVAMLLVPFQAGEAWPRYVLPVTGLSTGVPALYATLLIRTRTRAHTPVAASAAGVVLIALGFILSLL